MPRALPEPCLCLVTDRGIVDGGELVSAIVKAVSGGVDLVQLREKDLPGGQLLELAREIKIALDGRALLIINERVDVAQAVGADGVQLGEDALPVAAARDILGPDCLIGRSVHSREGAQQSAEAGADFLVVGTMYQTRSHPGEEPAGPGLLRQISGAVSLPLIGIGGITSENLGEIVRSGAQGVAVISSVLASPDPEAAARQLKKALAGCLLNESPAIREAVPSEVPTPAPTPPESRLESRPEFQGGANP